MSPAVATMEAVTVTRPVRSEPWDVGQVPDSPVTPPFSVCARTFHSVSFYVLHPV